MLYTILEGKVFSWQEEYQVQVEDDRVAEAFEQVQEALAFALLEDPVQVEVSDLVVRATSGVIDTALDHTEEIISFIR
jgi:hypothetical protein